MGDSVADALPEGLPDVLIEDTRAAQALLETLRAGPTEGVAAVLPELGALAVAAPDYRAVEHEPGTRQVLLDHLAVRVLGRKLRGLELRDRQVFQCDEALDEAAFSDEVDRLIAVAERGALPWVRAALIFADLTKGGTPAQRTRWEVELGLDLSVHNLASAELLERTGLLGRFARLADAPACAALVIELVRAHGLTGQLVRGETPLPLLAPFVRYLRGAARRFPGPADGRAAVDLAVDCLHLVNLCDTAGVREGLMTNQLRARFLEVEALVRELGSLDGPTELAAIEDELAAVEDERWRRLHPEASEADLGRARLVDRLVRLREGRQRRGEPRAAVERVVDGLDDATVTAFISLLRTGQLWYCEAATAGLSVAAQLRVLALAMGAAAAEPDVDTARPYHLTLLPLVARLHDDGDGKVRYRRRLIETMLAPLSLAELLAGPAPAAPVRRDGEADPQVLATFTTRIGGTTAIALDFVESEEAMALLTLLSIYERKSSAAFHATLKALCDLYGLRKDEFDRVANEAAYLVTMNAARSDKERLLDLARPGRIVEVGPGGGVVLDLLEARFPASEIIGIDVSQMVVEALEQRRQLEGRRWRILAADAFELPALMDGAGVDTVIFCSVLHEIYSYVEWPTRFRLESVRDLVRAAYQVLVPGGRLLIRDGVMPEPAPRRLRFLAPDARGFFDLFVAQFEGRRIEARELAPDRVELSAADAMEFLYTYTWGPESFPYEVREQYGILTYLDYRQHLASWLRDPQHPPRFVELPADLQSYLQPGYRAGLAGKVELTDDRDRPVELPDSNCVIVVEKG